MRCPTLSHSENPGVTVTDVQPLYMMKHSTLPVSLGTNLEGKKCSVWKQ